MAGALSSLLVSLTFEALGLNFSWSWWSLLLLLNVGATALSAGLGQLVRFGEDVRKRPSPLSSFTLVIGVVSSLALHAANALLQTISTSLPVAQNASVSGYIIANITEQPYADWFYLLLLFFVWGLALWLVLWTAKSMRSQQKEIWESWVYFASIVLFVINTLFLQSWIEPPEGLASDSTIGIAFLIAIAGAITLAALLYFFGNRVARFIPVFDDEHARAIQNGVLGLFSLLARLVIGVILGVLWAIVALLVLIAIGMLVAALLWKLPGVFEFLLYLVRLLQPIVTAMLPSALATLALLVSIIFGWRAARAAIATAPKFDPAFSGWHLNIFPIWVFGALLVATAVFFAVGAFDLLDLDIFAWLQRWLSAIAPALQALVVFVIVAQFLAITIFTISIAANSISWLTLGALLAGTGRAIASVLMALALLMGSAVLIAAISAALRWLIPILVGWVEPISLAAAVIILAVVLLNGLPTLISSVGRGWRWLATYIRPFVGRGLLALFALAAIVALTPLYPIVARLPQTLWPALASALAFALVVVPAVVRPVVEIIAILSIIALGLVGSGGVLVVLWLATKGLAQRLVQSMAHRPRTAAAIIGSVILVLTAPTMVAQLTERPSNPPPEETMASPPAMVLIAGLVFRNATHWRFNSVSEVSDEHGGYMPLPDAISADQTLCDRDVIVVIGAASSDGPPPYNQALASCRALSVGRVLEQRLSQCGSNPTGRIWMLNVGPSRRPTTLRSDRVVAVVGLDNINFPTDRGRLDRVLQDRSADLDRILGADRFFENYSSRVLTEYAVASSCPLMSLR